MAPLKEVYAAIPGFVIFWVLFAVALAFFGQRVWFLRRLLSLGAAEKRSGQAWARIKNTALTILGQRCTLKSVTRSDRAGLGHFFIFYGFVLFAASYLVFIFIGHGFGIEGIEDNVVATGYMAVLDIMAVVVALAILWGLVRRYVVRPERLEPKAEAAIILAVILFLMVAHLLSEGFGLAAEKTPRSSWLLVSSALAGGFEGLSRGALEGLHHLFWWLHYAVILGFLVYIPYSKHLHLLVSPLNVYFSSLEPKGALQPIDIETAEAFGASQIRHFSWKHLLDGYACTECGRCQALCPANATGKPLYPKDLMLNMKKHLLKVGPALLKGAGDGEHPLVGDIITEEGLWACTTCRQCMEECPVLNEQMHRVIDMRRHLVLEQGVLPETAMGALKSVESRGHPWRGTMASRTDWAQGLGVEEMAQKGQTEYLYWVGCTAALEDRSMKVAQALARVVKVAGIDFAILGAEETCCGEPARRLGNEYLFQTLAQQNIETFKHYGVRKIFTACPHCFNTIKFEYPQFGGEFEVRHHTELIADLLKAGRISLTRPLPKMVTYHDSCYLGRYNGIYDQPREVLRAIPEVKLTEMRRRRSRSFCCGGGGGRMWIEESTGQRINQVRTEEAKATRAELIATACPFCLQMFEDGIKAVGAEELVESKDLVELIAASLPEEG